MKGLEVAKDFYTEWGKEYLKNSFPELTNRVAIGRISGSDVIGADDNISKDHNWGPQFTIFLSEDDYSKYGEKLSAVMNAEAPNPWKGYRLDGGGDKSVNVESIPNWIKTWLGFSKKPSRNEDWEMIVKAGIAGGINVGRESTLYFLRHGAIWYDGSGEMSAWREALRYYPEKIWFIRVAEELFRVWQYGEYNFVQRVAKRNDPLANAVCIGEFVNSVMRTYLLLNRDYTPYWKWLAHEFRKLEEAQTVAPMLEELVSANNTEKQVEIVLKLSGDIYQEIKNGGIITGENNEHLLPLLSAHLELLAKGKSS
ncbi:MAG TPA: DUF4037 domain-containing protein [Anaerolineales bacterium]|nr:DUF4037 domain-containing protein [Anaerolineales bacterium]